MSDEITVWRIYLVGGLYGAIRFGTVRLQRGNLDSFATTRCRPSEVAARLPDGAIAIDTKGATNG